MTQDKDDSASKPAAPLPDDAAAVSPERRRFLARVCIGLGAGCGALGVPLVGFTLGPLLGKVPVVWRVVGKVSDFKLGETTNVSLIDASPLPWAGITARSAAWLRRTGDREFIAFSVNCAHLGCPVRWMPGARVFMCPCHGGVYYEDGAVAAGPPPHGLWQYPARVEGDDVQVRADPVPIG
jgi:menaquinol-cytochrome c reductase iron-sulfur subunit